MRLGPKLSRGLRRSSTKPAAPALSDCLFIEAVPSLARISVPWQDPPGEFGHWDAVYNRFHQWEALDIWRQRRACLRIDGRETATNIVMNSTIVCMYAATSTRLRPEKKRRASRTGFEPPAGWLFHQNLCRLPRCHDQCLPGIDQRRPP
jgi:transposase